MTDYSKIKHTVPPIEASRRYGTVKYGFMRCPFHADRVPSLKLYGDHFHCFGCGAHGDVVDLTAGLLGCSKAEAARRLEVDFGSGSAHPCGLAACKRRLGCRHASVSSRAAVTPSHPSLRAMKYRTTMPRCVRSTHGPAICSMLAQTGTKRG